MESNYVQQFKKGTLEMLLLCLIARKETYGYEIINALNDSSAAVFGYAREGTVYPILYRLEASGLIRCRSVPLIRCRSVPAKTNGGSKKYYSLTEKGKELLPELLSFWNRYTLCVDGFIASCAPPAEKQGETNHVT